jgi:hypothetical protein
VRLKEGSKGEKRSGGYGAGFPTLHAKAGINGCGKSIYIARSSPYVWLTLITLGRILVGSGQR